MYAPLLDFYGHEQTSIFLSFGDIDTNSSLDTFAGGNVSIVNRTQLINFEKIEDQIMLVRKWLSILNTVLSTVTCVIAIIFWIKIRKWRSFETFINLNVIFSSTAHSYILCLAFWGHNNMIFDNFWIFTRLFFYNLFICWLFIASIVLYRQVVQVYLVNVTRKRIKSSVFVVLMSLVDAILSTYHNIILEMSDYRTILTICAMYLVPSLLLGNLFIYIRVLWSLFNVARPIDRARLIQQVQVATVTFLMSGCMLLPALGLNLLTWLNNQVFPGEMLPLISFSTDLMKIIVIIYFFMLKANRKNWRKLLDLHRNQLLFAI